MIDWIKMWIRDPALIEQIRQLDVIPFEQKFNSSTGEVYDYPLNGKFNGWVYEIKAHGFLEIKGSFHKYWNRGYNHDDFTYTKLVKSIKRFCSELGVSPKEITIHNLEFGVNICPAMNATAILENVVCYKNTIAMLPIDDKEGYYLKYRRDNYDFKLYDKGRQINSKTDILRIELKALKMEFLKEVGIKNLADLMVKKVLVILGEKITNYFSFVIFDDDSIEYHRMTTPDQKVYLMMRNSKVWAILKGRKTDTYIKRERRFKQIVKKYGKHNYCSTISNMIEIKWKELLNG